MGDQRPGDNLYTASTVAVDVATGQNQGPLPVPPERLVGLGRGVAADPRRLPARRPHREGPGQRRAQRLPVVPGTRRRPDRLRAGHAVRAADRVPQPRSEDRPARRRSRIASRRTGKKAENFCPSHWGGKNWPPIAFSPKTRMIYIPANENLCDCADRHARSSTKPGERYIGATQRAGRWPPAPTTSARCRPGTSTPAQRVWTHNYPTSANWGSMLATGGGLVFTGGTNDRKLHAFDAAVGQAAVGVPDQLRHPRAAVVVHARRQAVHRGAVGLGHRLARHAEPPEHADQRRLSRRCPRAARSGCSRCRRPNGDSPREPPALLGTSAARLSWGSPGRCSPGDCPLTSRRLRAG